MSKSRFITAGVSLTLALSLMPLGAMASDLSGDERKIDTGIRLDYTPTATVPGTSIPIAPRPLSDEELRKLKEKLAPAREQANTALTAAGKPGTKERSAQNSGDLSPFVTRGKSLNGVAGRVGANSVDPLDFSQFTEDEADYLLPEAAKKLYENNGKITIPQPLAGGKATGKVPAGLEKYYAQKIQWFSCADFGKNPRSYPDTLYQCAYVIVPVDYANPDGPTAAIAMMKKKAANPDAKIGSIFADPGGPGGSGLWLSRYLGSNKRLERFDTIGFDPRGVGSSLPQIRCQGSAAFNAQREGSDALSGEQLDKILEYNTNKCYENTARNYEGLDGNTFIPQVGTENVVQDLDIMRSVVGDEKLSYIGMSYGTSIGYHYAKKFPENTRSLILDGQVNPLENNQELLYREYADYMPTDGKGESPDVAQMRGFGGTFKQYLKSCLQQGAKCPLSNPDDLLSADAEASEAQIDYAYKAYQEIVRKAWNTGYYHVTVEDSSGTGRVKSDRPVSFNDVNMGTIQAMYSTDLWGDLTAGLTLMKESQDAWGLLALADSYYNRDDDGKYDFSDASFRAISCTDSGEDFSDRNVSRETQRGIHRVAPFTDPGTDADGRQRGEEPQYGWCYYFKDRNKLPKGEIISDSKNIMVVSSTYDPATPFENGVVAADTLNATLVSVAYDAHVAYGSVGCATRVADAFLNDPDQFYKDYETGTFNKEPNYYGRDNVQTKDLKSKVITGNECQVLRFTKAMDVAKAKANAKQAVSVDSTNKVSGETLKASASGFAADIPVTFELRNAAGEKLLSVEVRADQNGAASADLALVQKVGTGKLTLKALQSEGEESLEASSVVTVADKDSSASESDTSDKENAVNTGTIVSTVSEGKVIDNPVKAQENLATTGANFIALMVSLLFVGTGAIILFQQRRNKVYIGLQ